MHRVPTYLCLVKSLKALLPLFWKYRVRLLLGVLFILLTNYFRILAPQLTGFVVNTVVAASGGQSHSAAPPDQGYNQVVVWMIHWLNGQSVGERVAWSGVILLILALISGFFLFLMRQTIIVMSRHIEFEQKNQIYAHYQRLDLHFFKTNSLGDLMNRISEDVSRVRMFTGPAIMYFINLAIILCFSVYFMWQTSPRLTLVALAPLPVLAIIIYWVNNIIHRKSESIQRLLGELTTHAQESYSGIRVIKSYVQEKAMLGFFQQKTNDYKSAALSLAKTEAIYFPAMALLIGLSTLLTIWVGCMDVLNDPANHPVGTIAEFVLYIQMLTFPVSAIGWTASMTQRAAVSQQRINAFLDQEPAIQSPAQPTPLQTRGRIVFNQVSFTYPDGVHPVISNFSWTIEPGQRVAVLGKTGSGKTTLLQLLLRMYDPQAGDIRLDSIPLPQLDLADLRQRMGYVPQDVFLFSETITTNLQLSPRFNANNITLEQATQQAAIHDEILQLSQGYETKIGERGITLSGGQKQRISIARALLANPDFLLLDDCLSAVDARTEQHITRALDQAFQGKTAIVVTHRIFTGLAFDQIIVLEQGQIVEQGTHDSLMSLNGQYAAMYRRQIQEADHSTLAS